MASALRPPNLQGQLPLRKVSATARLRNYASPRVALEPREPSADWDLDSLQAVRDAAERVRQSHDAWQTRIGRADEIEAAKKHRVAEHLRSERERREASQRILAEARAARLADEERIRAEQGEAALRAETEAEDARRAEENERKWMEEMRLRVAEEERQRLENEIAAILAQEEEDRLSRLEAEAFAEEARIAEEVERRRRQAEEQERARRTEAIAEQVRFAAEAERRRRQAEEQERARRARLRDCAVCLESHDLAEMIQVACEHWYCRDDLRGAIENACTSHRPFQCCQQTVLADHVRAVLTPELFARYNRMMAEVLDANPVYCSNGACGAYLPAHLASGPDEMRCSCGRSTCRHCKGALHAGTECVADVAAQQARALASRNGWKACPRCRNMVEKSSGCMHMTCRCGAGFCYRCGRLRTECRDACAA